MDKILNLLAEEFGKYDKIERAVLFGSRARGDNNERSDYDVAVFGDVSAADRSKLRARAEEELPTLHKIDLVFICCVSDPAFLRNVNEEGVIFYDKT